MRRRGSGSSLVGDGLGQALDAVLGEGNAEPQIREFITLAITAKIW